MHSLLKKWKALGLRRRNGAHGYPPDRPHVRCEVRFPH